jgi:hypothetical protein
MSPEVSGVHITPAMPTRVTAIAALLTVLILPGCVTTTLYETARVCPPGTLAGGIAATPLFWHHDAKGFHLEPLAALTQLEAGARVGIIRDVDAGFRLLPAPGLCVSIKYQLVRGLLDLAATGGANAYSIQTIDLDDETKARCEGAHLGLLASNEAPRGVPFSTQALLCYTRRTVRGAPNGSYKTDLWSTSLGLGLPLRVGAHRQFRIHPALTYSLPLSWRYRDWSVGQIHEPPAREWEVRGGVTYDLGVGFSILTAP